MEEFDFFEDCAMDEKPEMLNIYKQLNSLEDRCALLQTGILKKPKRPHYEERLFEAGSFFSQFQF